MFFAITSIPLAIGAPRAALSKSVLLTLKTRLLWPPAFRHKIYRPKCAFDTLFLQQHVLCCFIVFRYYSSRSMMQALNLIFIWWLETIDSSGKESYCYYDYYYFIGVSFFLLPPNPSTRKAAQTAFSRRRRLRRRTNKQTNKQHKYSAMNSKGCDHVQIMNKEQTKTIIAAKLRDDVKLSTIRMNY